MKSRAKIVILSYTFPPFGSVAGRRWFLFADALLKSKFEVEVIAAKEKEITSPWAANETQLIVKYFEHNFPSILGKTPKNLIEKIKYKLSLIYIEMQTKGTPYDKGIFWIKNVKKHIEQSQYPFGTIFILTGAPFSTLSLATWLKSKGYKLVIDFRDPYTWGSGYGMQTISKKRFAFELENEKNAITASDLVVCPNQVLQHDIFARYPESKQKIKILSHPIDEINIQKHWKKTTNTDTRLVYAGTLYDDCEQYFDDLISILDAQEHISFTIFTDQNNIPKQLISKIKNHSKIYFRAPIKAALLYQELQNYDGYLIISPPRVKDFVSTKYPDLLYFGIPVLLYSESGKLTEFLAPYQLAICIDNKIDLAKEILNLKKIKDNSTQLDLSEFNTKKVIDLIDLIV